MAEDKKGVVNDYNKQTVKQKDYYYDREETDSSAQKAFGDMLADLKQTNLKLKKELEGEKKVNINIDKGSEKKEK